MKSDLSCDSGFAQWCMDHGRLPEVDVELHKEALAQLLASFERGEITSLDGVVSQGSKAIKAVLGERPFEMNSNWICSDQDWRCPCCGRSKLEISRLGAKGQILAKLVVHHDHMDEAMNAQFRETFVANKIELPQSEGRQLAERIGKGLCRV